MRTLNLNINLRTLLRNVMLNTVCILPRAGYANLGLVLCKR